jgi:hypothetical protein
MLAWKQAIPLEYHDREDNRYGLCDNIDVFASYPLHSDIETGLIFHR